MYLIVKLHHKYSITLYISKLRPKSALLIITAVSHDEII